MIRTGIDALRSAQLDFLVSDATYRRGAETRSVKAVVGRTVFRSMTEEDMKMEDYIKVILHFQVIL